MAKFFRPLILTVIAATGLSGCIAAKTAGFVAGTTAKAAYKTGELATKGVIGTGKTVYKAGSLTTKGVAGTGKMTYKTGELTARGLIGTGQLVRAGTVSAGKGLYYVGKVPVEITDRAINTTRGTLQITTQIVDLAGKVASVTRQIQAINLQNEIAAIRNAANVVGVTIDLATSGLPL